MPALFRNISFLHPDYSHAFCLLLKCISEPGVAQLVGLVSRLLAGRPEFDFQQRQCRVQTFSGDRPTLYPVGAGCSFFWGKAAGA
jgi:hypothetical protein